jgi:hypothetical protein
VSHHGNHGQESTRGRIAPAARNHPVLQGIQDGEIWGPSDVYAVRMPLPADSTTLILGEVSSGMTEQSRPVAGSKNDPPMPVAWVRSYSWKDGPVGRVFVTTMGASQDFQSAALRRLFVNACYWAVGLEDAIPAESDVHLVGPYTPKPFGFGGFEKGQTVAALRQSH